MKFRIRFNKMRGAPGFGTTDHVWKVLDETGKLRLCKHIVLNVPSRGEKEEASEDWNIVCEGEMTIDRETSTISIASSSN